MLSSSSYWGTCEHPPPTGKSHRTLGRSEEVSADALGHLDDER
jgi:hypothetical protein